MIKYTMCFIKQNDNFLLLNRNKPMWMGSWNGIGGKIEDGETPEFCMVREVYEETKIKLKDIKYKGIIYQQIGNDLFSEIYTYFSELSEDYNYLTPRNSYEGILDWKLIPWILDSQNTGIAQDIPKFLPIMLKTEEIFNHLCIFNNDNILIDYKTIKSI